MLSICLVLFQSVAPAPAPQQDLGVELSIDREQWKRVENGYQANVDYIADFAGTLHVWIECGEPSGQALRVTAADGTLLASYACADSPTVPYVMAGVRAGDRLRLEIVGRTQPDASACKLQLRASPETPATEAASEQGETHLAEIRSVRSRPVSATDRLRQQVRIASDAAAQLIAVPGIGTSERGCATLASIDRFIPASERSAEKACTRRRILLEHFLRTRPGTHTDIQSARLRLAAALQLLADHAAAAGLLEEAYAALAATHSERTELARDVRTRLASNLASNGAAAQARAVLNRALDEFLHDDGWDSPDVQTARVDLGELLARLEDYDEAIGVFEAALRAFDAQVSPDSALLRTTLVKLVNVCREASRPCLMQTLRIVELDLREDPVSSKARGWRTRCFEDLQKAELHTERLNLVSKCAAALERASGELDRLDAERGVDVLRSYSALATDIARMGDQKSALAMARAAMPIALCPAPEQELDAQRARLELGGVLYDAGDAQAAREVESVAVEAMSRALPDDDYELNKYRYQYSATLFSIGEVLESKLLRETILRNLRRFPNDDNLVVTTKHGLAFSMRSLGDYDGSRSLFESVLESYSRTLDPSHPHVSMAVDGLATTLRWSGDPQAALALNDRALALAEGRARNEVTYLELRDSRAWTLDALSRTDEALALREQLLAYAREHLPESHQLRLSIEEGIVDSLLARGRAAEATEIAEHVKAVRDVALSAPSIRHEWIRVRETRALAWQLRLRAYTGQPADPSVEENYRLRCVANARFVAEAELRTIRTALLSMSAREAESTCINRGAGVDLALFVASGMGVCQPDPGLVQVAAILSESSRSAASTSAKIRRAGTRSDRVGELRELLRRQALELTIQSRRGARSDDYRSVIAARDRTEQLLIEALRSESPDSAASSLFDLDTLRQRLGEGRVAISFRRCSNYELFTRSVPSSSVRFECETRATPHLVAFVFRPPTAQSGAAAEPVTVVDLGEIALIEAAVADWRSAIGVDGDRSVGVSNVRDVRVRATGDVLRSLILDPLDRAFPGLTHIVVALDDVLHLVPLDCLPAGSGNGLVGEHRRVEVRTSLSELQWPMPRPSGTGPLVCVGSPAFNSNPVEPDGSDLEALTNASMAQPRTDALFRGGRWSAGFSPLPFSGEEAASISDLYTEVFDGRSHVALLQRARASRAALWQLAPGARWLHVATHGWFAADSVRSWNDPLPALLDGSGATQRTSNEQVEGMSPMLLCGLALAGANLPDDERGGAKGLITAEELATLDLTQCELAVLSACDTNVGVRRAGQGVASLQQALQMAGARSVITSLWRVPDEATKELMLDFYRRLWVERKPKWLALWEAKLTIRDAKDDGGRSKYSTRDWAAWVLTGEPD